MTANQRQMMTLDMGSRATMNVGMARTKAAAMTEYALTMGMQETEAPPPILKIPLNTNTSVAVRREEPCQGR